VISLINYQNKIVQEDMQEIFKEIEFNSLRDKTILITGATGMLATYLVYFLNYLNITENLNIKIIGLVRNMEKAIKIFEGIEIELLVQNIQDEIKYENKIDYIFHMASSANPKVILESPIDIIKANTIGTFNVFELARNKSAKVFFTSTREIYGKLDESIKFIRESDMGVVDCLERRACYPESKRIAETICNSYFYQYGVKYNIIRIAHVYGPGMNIDGDGRIMSDIIENVSKNQNIVLKSDGTALRAFCYITDAIRGLLLILIKGKSNEVYNLSNEKEEISIKDLAQKVIDISGKKIKIEYQISTSVAYTNYKRIGLNNEKLEKLGWKIKKKLEDGIKITLISIIGDKDEARKIG
jgi:UDP-glucuronate decarboxylase